MQLLNKIKLLAYSSQFTYFKNCVVVHLKYPLTAMQLAVKGKILIAKKGANVAYLDTQEKYLTIETFYDEL